MIEILKSNKPQVVKLRERHSTLAGYYMELLAEERPPMEYMLVSIKQTIRHAKTAKEFIVGMRNMAERMQSPDWDSKSYPILLATNGDGLAVWDGNKRMNISLALKLPVFALLPHEHPGKC